MADTEAMKKKKGHKHDMELQEIAGMRSTSYKLDHQQQSEKKLDEAPMIDVRYGSGYLSLGLSGEEIMVRINSKGNGWADPEPVIDSVMTVENAEHTIRSLITLVKEAKKNRIDTPGLFGNDGYRGYDLEEDNDDDKEKS